jgi:protein-S-isoprenylcysteine O-methyltransferase Ste14
MDKPTKIKALASFPLMLLVMGAPLFLAARTFDYWQAWLFVFVFSTATTIHGLILFKYAPELLVRRMKAGPTAEKRPVQRIIMTLVTTSFFALLVLCGFDHKLHWSSVPLVAVLFGDFLIAFSFVIFTKVCLQNHFASATIELADNQSVVSTGMYGVVRHPMYAGALLLMLGIPLALGSIWSSPLILVTIGVLIWRISDEENFLRAHLTGYTEYCQKVKFRLIPGIY